MARFAFKFTFIVALILFSLPGLSAELTCVDQLASQPSSYFSPLEPSLTKSEINQIFPDPWKSAPQEYVSAVFDVNGKEIPAQALLPEKTRFLYGFATSKNDVRNLTNCHLSALLFLEPELAKQLIDRKSQLSLAGNGYEVLQSQVLPLSPDEEPMFGDVGVIFFREKNPSHPGKSKWEALHSFIFVNSRLIFSKNGVGNNTGFFLQTFDQMRNIYQKPILVENNDIEIKYFRKK
jgi:hypothetical protein